MVVYLDVLLWTWIFLIIFQVQYICSFMALTYSPELMLSLEVAVPLTTYKLHGSENPSIIFFITKDGDFCYSLARVFINHSVGMAKQHVTFYHPLKSFRGIGCWLKNCLKLN